MENSVRNSREGEMTERDPAATLREFRDYVAVTYEATTRSLHALA